VVEVLAAPFGIEAGGLEVGVRSGGDPNVRPCRGDPQGAHALQRLGIYHRFPARVKNHPLPLAALATQTKLASVDVNELIELYRRGLVSCGCSHR
jgi:hypothetical protein